LDQIVKLTRAALPLLTALVLWTGAFTASAAPITLSFAGTLTSTFGTLISGQAFSGSYTFDPAVAGTGTSSFAVFDDLLSVSLTVGAFSATIGPGVGLAEIQQDDVPLADRYALVGRNPVGSSLIGGLAISGISFRLDDTTGTAISDALVLLTNPSLSSFTGETFFIFFGDPTTQDFEAVTGTLTSLGAPEPGTLALLGIGIAGLAWRRRKQ
jgi:hypothetical protein